MMRTDMDRLDREGRLDARLGRGDRHGRNHLLVKGARAPFVFLFRESCGQCTPCREARMVYDVNRIEHGRGETRISTPHERADNIAGRTIWRWRRWALPVKSFIQHFRGEFQYHIDNKRCMVRSPDIPPRRASRAQRHTDTSCQLTIDGRKQIRTRHVMDGQRPGNLHSAFLLPQEASIAATAGCVVQIEKAPSPSPPAPHPVATA